MNDTEKDLRLYFEMLGLSLEDWGKGEAKTIEHLAEELHRGECRINGVFREIHTVVAEVICGDEKLREVCQAFKDGRIRERRLAWGSVGEKLANDEKPVFGLWRAFKEELGIPFDPGVRTSSISQVTLVKMSTSYPGLITRNIQERFIVKLPKHLYRQNGYFENQPDKTTYFEWVPRTKE
jgi:hypothetical protein